MRPQIFEPICYRRDGSAFRDKRTSIRSVLRDIAIALFVVGLVLLLALVSVTLARPRHVGAALPNAEATTVRGSARE